MNEQHNDSSKQDGIRLAMPGDLEALDQLMRSAFPTQMLEYTIFRSPKSISFLQKLLTTDQVINQVYVATAQGSIAGYYHARGTGGCFMLNYIAVDKRFRNQGLGRLLLDHFEREARLSGYSMVGLDVYVNNERAYDWYLNRSYRPTHHTRQIVVEVQRIAYGKPVLHWDNVELSDAIREESLQGFSKVKAQSTDAKLVVGIIGGDVCKLLEYEGLSLDEALSEICSQFSGARTELVVGGLDQIPRNLQIKQSSEIVRLAKDIQ